MKCKKMLWHLLVGSWLGWTALAAQAQADYSAYGVLDFSYGRFEPSGQIPVDHFNSNSMSPSFVGVNANYGFDGGWKPGITLESFFRFQDFQLGRNSNDPLFSRKALVSLASDYGTLSVGRLQTLMFDATSRFNAMGNSVSFSPAFRHVFLSGNLESVEDDIYWDRGVGYVSPSLGGVTASLQYAAGATGQRSDLSGANLVFSRGLFAAELSAQHVHSNDGFTYPLTDQSAWQIGATYNFGFLRAFGLYTQIKNSGLDVRSHSSSAGVEVPLGPGKIQAQAAYTTATGPAVDRKHTSISAAYLYAYDSVTEIYVVGMDDLISGQTKGLSLATGVRFRF